MEKSDEARRFKVTRMESLLRANGDLFDAR
jgi:hypothetical protein